MTSLISRLATALCVFVFLLVPKLALSEEILTLEEFLERLEKTHPFLESAKQAPLIAYQSQLAELGSSEWKLQAEIGYQYDEPADLGIAVPRSSSNFGLDASATKEIWDTGGTFSVNVIDGLLSRKPQAGTPPDLVFFPRDFYNKGVFLSFSQPLLKNYGGVNNSLDFDLKTFDTEISKLRTNESIELFLLNAGSQFVQLVEAQEKLKIFSNRVELARKTKIRAKKRQEAGVTDKADLYRSEESFWAAKQAFQALNAQRKSLASRLARLLTSDGPASIKAKMNLYKLSSLPSDEELERHILESSRSVKAIEIERERAERNIEGLSEKTEHDLSLNISAGIESGSEDFDDSFELDRPEAGLSLSYSRSLGQGGARADAERARLQKLQVSKNYQNELRSLGQSATGLLNQIKGLQPALVASRSQISSAVKRTKAEKELYEQGRGSLNFVLQALDSEQAARLTYAETAALYQTLKLQLDEIQDKLY